MSPEPEEIQKPGYLVLARKYRPRQFSQVVGQEAVVRTLQNAIRENRIGHAYLFSGMRGVGKTTVARILAKALNCEKGPTPEPCNQCFMCQAINNETLLDFIEIDGASNRGIEDVKALRESIQYEPMHSRYRVIIIDEVHQLSRDAFNALLKTLEEPPTRTVFIFATTEFHKVPKTIASRCQHFVFKRLTNPQIMNHLRYLADQEKIDISSYSLKLIADAADGSLRDAETLLDMVVSFSGSKVRDKETEEVLGIINRSLFEDFSRIILESQAGEVFPLVESLVSAGYDLRHFYSGLIEYFRNLLLVKVSANPAELLAFSEEEINRLKEVGKDQKKEDLLRYILMLQEGEAGLRYSAQPRIFLEAWLVKLCYLKNLKPVEEILEEISRLKDELKRNQNEQSVYPTTNSTSNLKSNVSFKQATKTAEYNHLGQNQNSVPKKEFSVFGQEAADVLYFRVMKEKPALAPILKTCKKVEVKESIIKFIFGQDKKHFAELISQHLVYLNRVALELSGKEFELQIEEGQVNQAVKENSNHHPEIRESARNDEAKKLLQDPKTKALLSSIKGQVIAVKKKPRPDQT